MARAAAPMRHLRLVSTPHVKEIEMAKAAPARQRTDTPGVYRRGNTYTYTYRVEGRQRWGTAPTLAAARRAKRQAEADSDRGLLVDIERIKFGVYARDWIKTYQGRTSSGFRESTRRWYRQVLEQRIIRTSTAVGSTRRHPSARGQGVHRVVAGAGGPAPAGAQAGGSGCRTDGLADTARFMIVKRRRRTARRAVGLRALKHHLVAATPLVSLRGAG
jgi:hypothetical protein